MSHCGREAQTKAALVYLYEEKQEKQPENGPVSLPRPSPLELGLAGPAGGGSLMSHREHEAGVRGPHA